MSWTLTTSGAAIVKAGAGANTTIVASGSALAKFSDQSEAVICVTTRKDWLTNYANLTATHKLFLDDLTSNMVALEIVKYDKSYYQAESEQQTLMDILTDKIKQGLEILRDLKNQVYP